MYQLKVDVDKLNAVKVVVSWRFERYGPSSEQELLKALYLLQGWLLLVDWDKFKLVLTLSFNFFRVFLLLAQRPNEQTGLLNPPSFLTSSGTLRSCAPSREESVFATSTESRLWNNSCRMKTAISTETFIFGIVILFWEWAMLSYSDDAFLLLGAVWTKRSPRSSA